MAFHWIENILNKSYKFIPYKKILKNGTRINYIDLGIIEIIPPQAKHGVIISSGIHGNETAPIELVDKIADKIINKSYLLSTRVLLIIAHNEAILKNKRMIKINLNRLFENKNLEKNEECILANKLQKEAHHFFLKVPKNEYRWHFDLHCSIRASQYPHFALIPNRRHPQNIAPLINFLSQSKIDAILFSRSPSPTFSWWTNEYLNALSVTVELGQVMPLFENDLTLLDNIEKALFSLMAAHDTALIKNNHHFVHYNKTKTYKVTKTITKLTDGFKFLFARNLSNFTSFKKGECIALEENGDKYLIEKKGEKIIFPNENVAIGQRACLLIYPMDLKMRKGHDGMNFYKYE